MPIEDYRLGDLQPSLEQRKVQRLIVVQLILHEVCGMLDTSITSGGDMMGVAKYKINDSFFEQDSSELWYYLGFIASDGYVCDEKIELCLNKKDEHILFRLRDKICPDKPIYDKPSTHSKKFTIHSKRIACNIKSLFGMETNKKSSEIILPDIPCKYARDFVRGLIDGDGCIDTTKAYKNDKVYVGARLRILGSREFLTELIKLINKFVPNNTKCIQKKGSEGVWYITYNFSTAIKILEWCYYEGSMCLLRKYNKFKEVSNMKK